MRLKTRSHGAPLALCVLVASGCFQYVPAQLETTPPGTGVQVLVTRAGSDELREIMDVDLNAPVVRGTMVEMDDGDVVLDVPVGRLQEGFMASNIDQRVRVPAGEIVSFERRELNGFATGAAIGAAALGVGLVFAIINDALQGDDGDPPDPPDEFRGVSIPLFSLPWGR